MHVPYSMDDSEPDLYGSLGGSSCHNDDWETQTKWEGNNIDPYPHSTTYNPMIVEQKSYSQAEMDKVIQHNIDKVRLLENQLDNAKWLLNEIYQRVEQLPLGYSQLVREFIKQ